MSNLKNTIEYPSEVTFKSIFRNIYYTHDSIKNILSENGLACIVEGRESKNGRFISFTITATFPSGEVLHSICRKISSLEGFMTLF